MSTADESLYDAAADRHAEDLDDAAWAHARLRCYGNSADELDFVRAFKAAATGQTPELETPAAEEGYRSGLRAYPPPLSDADRETMQHFARTGGWL